MPRVGKPGLTLALVFVGTVLILPARGWPQSKMEIRTDAFTPGGPIPAKYTCSGANVSPALAISGVPQPAKALALIVDDPDAPSGTFVHWVVYNLPPQTTHIDEDVAKGNTMPGGGMQGRNDFGGDGYGGPCPPPGKPHHYRFRLFALNGPLQPPSASGPEVERAMQGHILASAVVVGTFQR
jgi:Raf kinase inhibitor-like YbhB/YbcL family protein